MEWIFNWNSFLLSKMFTCRKVGGKTNYLARHRENAEYVSVQKCLQNFTEFTCVYFGWVKLSKYKIQYCIYYRNPFTVSRTPYIIYLSWQMYYHLVFTYANTQNIYYTILLHLLKKYVLLYVKPYYSVLTILLPIYLILFFEHGCLQTQFIWFIDLINN